ncbi:MAG: outer membrane protein [Gammaproteobacteria bacterium]
MINLLRKSNKAVVIGLLSLGLISSPAFAGTSGFYLGVFGGGGALGNEHVTQTGIAFFPASRGGPLNVHASGDPSSNTVGIGGMHVGYEWHMCPPGRDVGIWNIVPAVELEGYYLGVTQNGHLINPTTRLPEHNFKDNFPMNNGVILANGVFTLKTPYSNVITPYVGGGVGTAILSISGANSLQTAPAEPGINHFNSNTNASDWTFAAQAKVGLHFDLTCYCRLFAEYRYLYLSPTSYTFGATKYPTHVPTTKWNVNFASMNYNMGAAGIEFTL